MEGLSYLPWGALRYLICSSRMTYFCLERLRCNRLRLWRVCSLGFALNLARKLMCLNQRCSFQRTLQARKIASNLSISLSSDLGLYLGMPLIHSRVRSQTYGFLLTKVRRRLSGWKMRQLSMAARSLLIQSVVSTIPSYAMQTAKIPFYLINWKGPCVSSYGQRTRIAAGCILWHGVRFALQKP